MVHACFDFGTPAFTGTRENGRKLRSRGAAGGPSLASDRASSNQLAAGVSATQGVDSARILKRRSAWRLRPADQNRAPIRDALRRPCRRARRPARTTGPRRSARCCTSAASSPSAARDRDRPPAETGHRLGHVLVDLGFVTAEAVLEALSLQIGVPTVRINAFTVNTEALSALPEKVARRHTAFPLQKVGTTLMVALASPKDLTALDDLRFACGCEIQTVLALEHEIVSAIDRYYRDEWVPMAGDGGTQRVGQDRVRRNAVARARRSGRALGGVDAGAGHRARREGTGERHPFRAAARRTSASASAWTARSARSRCCRSSWRRRWWRGSRCSPAWTSPSTACRRTAASARRSTISISTCAARPIPTVHGEKAVLRLLDSSGLKRSLEGIGHGRDGARHDARADPPARRDRAHHRTDRERQDVDALRFARRAGRDRQEHRHHRGSGRVRDRRASTRDRPTTRPASRLPAGFAPRCGRTRT